MVDCQVIVVGFSSEVWSSYPQEFPLEELTLALNNSIAGLKFGMDIKYQQKVSVKMSDTISRYATKALVNQKGQYLGAVPYQALQYAITLSERMMDEDPEFSEQLKRSAYSAEDVPSLHESAQRLVEKLEELPNSETYQGLLIELNCLCQIVAEAKAERLSVVLVQCHPSPLLPIGGSR